jgi:acetyltransferase-like isoleucine patch superfamily enzyme
MVITKFYSWLQRSALAQRSTKMIKEGRLTIGRESYGTPRYLTFANDPTSVTIGAYCSIGPDVTFLLGGNHPTDRVTTFPLRERFNLPDVDDGFPSSRGDINVGNDVWIGYGATILSGVTIGHGAVVGAMSVVTKDIPSFAIAVGNPARVVRFRLDQQTQRSVLDSRWWTMSEGELIDSVEALNDRPASEGLNEGLRND